MKGTSEQLATTAGTLSVLVVEDNPGDAVLVREALADAGARAGTPDRFGVARAATLAEGLAHLAEHPVDVVLLDLTLPDSTGLATLRAVRAAAPDTPIIALTGLDDEALALEAVRAGAQDYLVKGQADGVLLVRAITYAIERKRAELDRARLAEEERARREAEHARKRSDALSETSRLLGTAGLDELAILETTAGRVVQTVGDGCAVALIDEAGEHLTPVVVHHADPDGERAAVAALRGRTVPLGGRSAFTGVVQRRRPVLLPALTPELLEDAAAPEHAPFFTRAGVRGLMVVPLVVGDELLGTVMAWRDRTRTPFGEGDAGLLQETAGRAAVALALARTYRASQNAVTARDEFLAIAAHELRTPLTAIKGHAQLLKRAQDGRETDEERLARWVGAILDGVERLTDLTDDLLDVARIRTGQFALRPRPVDVVALVDRVCAHCRDSLDGRHELVVALPDEPCVVAADAGRIEQVLENLLGNAVKYSPEGGTVRVAVAEQPGGVEVAVRDDGIGLPPDALEAVFEPFARAANALTRELPGLGLGLYICRDIARRHGGRLWAESDGDGQGTTMRLFLPTRQTPTAPGD